MRRNSRSLLIVFAVAALFVGTVLAAAPTIKSLSPVNGFPGTPFTIAGANFGPTQGASAVTFNGKPLTIISWSDTVIKTGIGQMPLGAGKVVVTVNGVASNAVTFYVLHRGK